ncbi:hypothetical protein HZA87_05800 [Candidatus Uhrbacteria bacterium]|nr:hypothetical protein [Candidatus Uhrbacteria bacterium]
MCHFKGCEKPSFRKQYCPAHLSPVARRKLTTDMGARIRSGCCSAKCTTGEPHEFGEQYCTKCDLPCCWKAPVA